MGERRYNTEIPTEHYFKYRPKYETKEGDFYFGSDSDMVYKTFIAMKRGAFVGFATGATICTYHPKGFTKQAAIEKFFRHSYPPLVAATTFALTMSLSTLMRNKEDAWNHALGGYAAGTMLGTCYKSAKAGVFSGLALAVVASFFKCLADNGMFNRSLIYRKERVFDFYRTGWMIERPDQEGVDDADKNDAIKHYSP